MLKVKGFTLIEALIAILITAILAVIIAGLLTSFAFKTSDRVILSCLVEGASSGISACKGGNSINSINCGGYTVQIEINGNCPPAPGTCSEITATAKVKGLSFSLTDKVCNFD
jgi:prepilin-type N-terminal cleavage/methylation domain-containing protein